MAERLVPRVQLCASAEPFVRIPDRPDPGVLPSRSVRLAELDPAKKRRVWAWLKANDPGTAELLQSDDVQTVLRGFPGSSPVLDIDTVRSALE